MFYILLNTLNDTPYGILLYYKVISVLNGYKDNILSEMEFISGTMSNCQSIYAFVK